MFKPFFLKRAIREIYQPYFAFKKENAGQWIIVALMIAGNIFQACMVVFINTAFNHFFGILSLPGLTYLDVFKSIGNFLFTVMLYVGAAAFNEFLADTLTYRLDQALIPHFIKRWAKSGATYGINFIKENVSPAMVISQDIGVANETTIRMANQYVSTFFNLLVGLYGLWQLSMPLTLQITTMVFVIPGYMVIGALLYSISYNLIVHLASRRLDKTVEAQQDLIHELGTNIHHTYTNAESIKLLRGYKQEKRNLLGIFKNTQKYNAILINLKMKISALNALNMELQFFVGMLLSVPQIIAKTISVDNIFVVSSYFTQVVSFFTWRKDNNQELTTLKVLSKKITGFGRDIENWEKCQAEKQLNITQSDSFIIKSLIVKKPNGNIVIDQKEFEFNQGITIIQGASGAGKTTLFRALAGLWPFAEGEVEIPFHPSKFMNIPQVSYFPLKSTLFDVITYPRKEVVTESEKREIIDLMRHAELNEDAIANCEEEKNWSTLSPGEKQRIAIIRAIFHRPSVLFMDEPFSALNLSLKTKMESLLKEKLADSYIIYIDHQAIPEPAPVVSLYDYQVKLANSQLVKADEDAVEVSSKMSLAV